MSPTVVAAVIGGIAGLVTGAIASVVAPWVNWGIEKRRKKHEYRVAIIETWRHILLSASFDRDTMLRHPAFGALEPLLSREAKEQVLRPHNRHIVIVGGTGDPAEADRNVLQREVARIEREWKLI